jgi:hypothetical protein
MLCNLFRESRTKEHPRTPDIHRKHTKRGFDGLVRLWRVALHKYDPEPAPKPIGQLPADSLEGKNWADIENPASQADEDDVDDLGECLFAHTHHTMIPFR